MVWLWIVMVAGMVILIIGCAVVFRRRQQQMLTEIQKRGSHLSERDMYQAKCGHSTKQKDKLNLFGKEVECELTIQEDGTIDYCHRCIESMAIRCAWCGEPILVGDPITLLSPVNPDFKIPEQAVVYKEEPLTLVGCLRWNCADSGGLRAGFWVPHGKVHRVASPVEMAWASPDEVVIVSDLTDPKEAQQASDDFLKKP